MPKSEPNVSIEDVIALILKDAEDRRTAAGYGGRSDDGGAGRLENQVQYYNYGRQLIIPPEWKEYIQQAQREADPEYAEYQRLHKKFGNG